MPDSLAILLPLPLAGSYDYLVEGLALAADTLMDMRSTAPGGARV